VLSKLSYYVVKQFPNWQNTNVTLVCTVKLTDSFSIQSNIIVSNSLNLLGNFSFLFHHFSQFFHTQLICIGSSSCTAFPDLLFPPLFLFLHFVTTSLSEPSNQPQSWFPSHPDAQARGLNSCPSWNFYPNLLLPIKSSPILLFIPSFLIYAGHSWIPNKRKRDRCCNKNSRYPVSFVLDVGM